MVYACNDPVERCFSLAEYVEFVLGNIDTTDFESMRETSWSLRALANDRDFILSCYHNELKRWVAEDRPSTFFIQSIPLHVESRFIVRCNVWPSSDKWRGREEKAMYAYDVPHNHNFHFCTVGYFGPGYSTHLWRCKEPPCGYIDEPVQLLNLGELQLEPGCTMVYEAFTDVHVQSVPTSVSISLNLISVDPETGANPQCIFDVDRSRVAGSVGSTFAMKLFLIDLLRDFHNEESVELLIALVGGSCPRTGALALSVLRDISPGEYERVFGRASREVRGYCAERMVIGDDFTGLQEAP